MRRVGRALRAAWHEARSRGLYALARRAWRIYAWHDDRVIVVEFVLTARPPRLGSDGIIVRRGNPQDLVALRSLDPEHTGRMLRLIDTGDCWLHVARHGDRLVGYRFATRGFWGHGVFAKVIRPALDQAFIHNLFVHDDYRGRDIAGRLVDVQNLDLMAEGIRGVLATINVTNLAALRVRRTGARPTLFVHSRRRVFYHRLTVSTTIPSDIRQLLDTGPS